jgi:hypothetical protein
LEQTGYLSKLNNALTAKHIQSLASVTDIDEKLHKLTANWENGLINGLFDSSLVGLRGKGNIHY